MSKLFEAVDSLENYTLKETESNTYGIDKLAKNKKLNLTEDISDEEYKEYLDLARDFVKSCSNEVINISNDLEVEYWLDYDERHNGILPYINIRFQVFDESRDDVITVYSNAFAHWDSGSNSYILDSELGVFNSEDGEITDYKDLGGLYDGVENDIYNSIPKTLVTAINKCPYLGNALDESVNLKESEEFSEEAVMKKCADVIRNIAGVENVSDVEYSPYASNGEYFVSFICNGEKYVLGLGIVEDYEDDESLEEGAEERKSLIDRVATKTANMIVSETKKLLPDFMKNYTFDIEDHTDEGDGQVTLLGIFIKNEEGEQLESFIGINNPAEDVDYDYWHYKETPEVLYIDVCSDTPEKTFKLDIRDLNDLNKISDQIPAIAKKWAEIIASSNM